MKMPMFSTGSVQNNFLKSWNDLHGILSFVLISIVVFLAGIAAGLAFPQKFEPLLSEFSRSTSHLLDRGMPALILLIFIRNSLASLIAVSFGVFFGIVPIAAAFLNGALVGTVLSGVEASRMFTAILILLPHGIFELPALFISWGLGLWTGSYIIKKNQETFMGRQKRAYRILLFLVLPLLLIAAVIEGSAIALLRGA
jgi:stage II sporulation protein M